MDVQCKDEIEAPRFLTKGFESSHSAGEYLFRRGDPVGEGAVYFVLEGRAVVERAGDSPGASFSFEVGPGDFFGACSTYGAETRVLQGRALGELRVYRWSRKDFDFILGVYQEAARHLIQSLSRRLRSANHMGAA